MPNKIYPEYFLDLNFNGSLLLDPKAIGNFDWPVDTKLLAFLNKDLTNFFFDLKISKNHSPYNSIIASLFNLTGLITFSLYNNELRKKVVDKEIKGFYFHQNIENIFDSENTFPHSWGKPSAKNIVAAYCQKIFIKLLAFFHIPIRLSAQKNIFYDRKNFGIIFRLFNIECIFRCFDAELSKSDIKGLAEINTSILKKVSTLIDTYHLSRDPVFERGLEIKLQKILEQRFIEYKKIRLFMGTVQFDFYDQSLTNFPQGLFSEIARENGGMAYSSFHGSGLSSDEPDVASIGNSDVFVALNDAMEKDANEIRQKLPGELGNFKIYNLKMNNFHERVLKEDKERKNIKHVAIMGRSIISRVSTFNSLDNSYYFDVEKRLSEMLLTHGFDVTFKAHPESNWKHFDEVFDKRVNIEWRPFQEVSHEYDAVFFHFSATSTLVETLATGLHIFILKDGWHDKLSWPARTQLILETYANTIEAQIGDNGFAIMNQQQVIDAFHAPKVFNTKKRLSDWFNLT